MAATAPREGARGWGRQRAAVTLAWALALPEPGQGPRAGPGNPRLKGRAAVTPGVCAAFLNQAARWATGLRGGWAERTVAPTAGASPGKGLLRAQGPDPETASAGPVGPPGPLEQGRGRVAWRLEAPAPAGRGCPGHCSLTYCASAGQVSAGKRKRVRRPQGRFAASASRGPAKPRASARRPAPTDLLGHDDSVRVLAVGAHFGLEGLQGLLDAAHVPACRPDQEARG